MVLRRDPLGNVHPLTPAARELRKRQTDAERKLWTRLRDRRLGGFKFHRQYRIGPFISDFCCFEKRLVVEVDGGQHSESADADENRTVYLSSQGYRVIRFWNGEVLKSVDEVCEEILRQLSGPSPPPSPQGEGA